MILDTFPSPEVFYKTYWGKKPFIVRGHVPRDVIDTLIDGDSLAGLALEEGVRSRIITNSPAGDEWACEHGPFDEDDFDQLGKRDWSILVQNVEQYHTETAELLKYFQSSPRWLLDDVMVSFSATGGSVGPHTDSYHTFLVQGIGKRSWKISNTQIDDNRYVDNPDVKVLKHGFDGVEYEVTAGDVIYMPPFFGHEGKTIETAMTFSVGFLGPKLSEMLGDYAQYLDENEDLNTRYLARDLGANSAGFSVGAAAQTAIKTDIIGALQSDDFARWMAQYFATPSHDDIDLEDDRTPHDKTLQQDDILYRPEHVKFAITTASNSASSGGALYISALGQSVKAPITPACATVIDRLNDGQDIAVSAFWDDKGLIDTLTTLYQSQALYCH